MNESESVSSEYEVIVVLDGKASPFLTINTDLQYFIPRPPSTATSLSNWGEVLSCSGSDAPPSDSQKLDALAPDALAPDALAPDALAPCAPDALAPCVSDEPVSMSDNPLGAASSRGGVSAKKKGSVRGKRGRAAAFPFAALGLIVLIVLI
jgi:hypothetical protein